METWNLPILSIWLENKARNEHGINNMEHGNHSLNRKHHHSEKNAKNKSSHSHGEHGNHGAMVQDFKKRFWISLIVTIPVLLLSHTVRSFFGLEDILAFRGDVYILFVLSSFIFFYVG